MKWAGYRRSGGYTIVETMIFLAVSGALFASAMALVNGRQARTEFASNVRNFETQLNDLANDVANGYFAVTSQAGRQVQCYTSGLAIVISETPSMQRGCILIGKTIQFSPTNAGLGNEYYSVFNLIGRQYVEGNFAKGDVKNYDESGVVAVYPAQAPYGGVPDAVSDVRIGTGVTVGCVLYTTGGAEPSSAAPCSNRGSAVQTDAVTFMTTFQQTNFEPDKEVSGSSRVNLVVHSNGQALGRPKADVARQLDQQYTLSHTIATSGTAQQLRGVFICLQSNGSSQYAIVKLGAGASQSSAAGTIQSGSCW